jgi:Transposase and inactivated derivatives
MSYYREILRLHSQGISQRSIASACTCSRNTVARILRRAEEKGITWPQLEKLDDKALEQQLFGERRIASKRKYPDYEHIHREMAKSGVTLSLLWNEYCETCRLENSIPLMYTQFCYHYQQFTLTSKATMHIQHKPGEKMEVDWAGTTAALQDNITGNLIPVYMFVAVLPCSGYAYVEGFLSQDQENWIGAHVNAFKYFGGVSRILVPDNLKTGVERPDWYTPVINRIYHEMAEHYDTAVIPARVRRPKDKPSVEGVVGVISTWIIAALRNRQFFSIGEFNESVRIRLDEFNRKPFQKKPGSRLEAFEEEKAFLLPLPEKSFEMALWKIATVQFNYHIAVEKMHYSVPYEYIKHKVDVRLTKNVIEIFYGGNRIASHIRLNGRPGQYSTVTEHMPVNHQQYIQWNAERFISWAQGIGESTEAVVRAILVSRKVEQQAYKACIALLKLADRYSLSRLEEACKRALFYTPSPSFKSVQSILKIGSDKTTSDKGTQDTPMPSEHGFTRGADYYRRMHDAE